MTEAEYFLDKSTLVDPFFRRWLFRPIDGSEMHQVNLWHFYHLGQRIHALLQLKAGAKFDDLKYSLTGLHWILLHYIERRPIPLTKTIPFIKILDDVITKLPDVFTQEDIDKLQYAIYAFEGKLEKELDPYDVFYIPPKGTHSTLALIETAETNLPPAVVGRLSSQAVLDVQQAGRCLALDAPTAAGFHILRAVESLALAYVNRISGKPHPKKNRDWGAYIRVIRNGNGSVAIADYLYHMKETYRNPIMHPDVTLTTDEAFALFNASLSAIVQLDAAIVAWPEEAESVQ